MRRQLECLRSHLDADVQARLTDDVLEGVFGEGAEGEVANSKGPG